MGVLLPFSLAQQYVVRACDITEQLIREGERLDTPLFVNQVEEAQTLAVQAVSALKNAATGRMATEPSDGEPLSADHITDGVAAEAAAMIETYFDPLLSIPAAKRDERPILPEWLTMDRLRMARKALPENYWPRFRREKVRDCTAPLSVLEEPPFFDSLNPGSVPSCSA